VSRPVLVCGAAGTVGRAVLGALRRRGMPSIALVRSAEAADKVRPLASEVRTADMADDPAVSQALTGVESVLLLTKPSPTQLALEERLIRALRSAGVRRVVRISVIGADAQAASPVRRWHGEAERQLAASGLNAVSLRANFFMQNFLGMRAAIAAKGRFSLPLGNARVSMVDVRDIGDAAARLLEDAASSPGASIDLTGPRALSMDEAATLIGQVWGCPCSYRDLPIDQFEAAMLRNGSPPWLAQALGDLYSDMQAGLNTAVNDDLGAVLGRPSTSFEDFLEREVRP
jgi:uncharacterized protein YbjT (DUF2867 family)